MLTNLSKLLDKSFIIGFLLPTTIFVAAGCHVLGAPEILKSILAENKVDTGSAALLIGGIWLLATLLMSFNLFSYKLLEGYYYPLKGYRRGKRKTSKRINWLRGESDRLRQLIVDGMSTEAGTGRDELIRDLRGRRRPIMEELARLPLDPHDVLPTAFGNAIRAFERYPNEVYGADGVLLWYRIAPLVPKPLLDTVTEARSAVDFMVSNTVLSAVLALSILARIADSAMPGAWAAARGSGTWMQALSAVPTGDAAYLCVSVVASLLFYRLAVLLVPDWGDAVKACYDIGLPELAKKLGYELPDNGRDRRAFWVAVSRTVGFTKNSDGKPFLNPEDWKPAKGVAVKAQAAEPPEHDGDDPGKDGDTPPN